MKVFVSSVITGYEAFRDAAASAATVLGHEVKRAEDFIASPRAPQVVCLDGVRWADIVVVLLGARYGAVQPSGLSATHEEYREAKDRGKVLAYVQQGIQAEAPQAALINEVREWSRGQLAPSFSTPAELRDRVIQGLHQFSLQRATGPPNEAEMIERATSRVQIRGRSSGPEVAVVLAGGPRQTILRPSQLEDAGLVSAVVQQGLFGEPAIFTRRSRTDDHIVGGMLTIEQERNAVSLDELGTIVVRQAVGTRRSGELALMVLIEEDVRECLAAALAFGSWMLDRVDPTERLAHVVPVVGLARGGTLNWRTRAEAERSPNRVTVTTGPEETVVMPNPPVMFRATLRHDGAALAEDFIVLLRRQIRDREF
jgi:hypothetical protein